jgi:hypothetical protein
MQAAGDLCFRLTLTQRIFAAAICAAILGDVPAASNAADLGPGYRVSAEHFRTSQPYWNWLQRCAYAGYYYAYAEFGYVYHYPFDDRPVAHTHYRWRFRKRFLAQVESKDRPESSSHALPNPDPGFLYSGLGGLKMSSTRAPLGPARMVCGTLLGVRQKSPFFTGISSPP